MMTLLQRLVHIVKLKNAASKLSDVEYAQLIISASQKFGNRESILNVLCGQSTKYSDPELINKMHKMITNIIQSRTKNIIEQSISHSSIDTNLPSPIIGEVASYLDQKSYARFSRGNRTVFIATNSPNTLTEIDVTSYFRIANLPIILVNHPQIIAFSCRSEHIDQLNSNNAHYNAHHNNNRVRKAKVISTTSFFRYVRNWNPQNLHQQKYINFAELDQLHLGGPLENDADLKLAFEILKLSRNITHLDVHKCSSIQRFMHLIEENRFQNLKSLTLCNGNYMTLLRSYGSQLTSLSFMKCQTEPHILQNVYFSNLESLSYDEDSMTSSTLNEVNAIIQSSKNLKRLTFDIPPDAEPKYIQDFIGDTLKQRDKLIDLNVRIYDDEDIIIQSYSDAVFNGMEYGLSQLKRNNKRKDVFHVRLQIMNGNMTTTNMSTLCIERLINQLNEICDKSFTIIIEERDNNNLKNGIQSELIQEIEQMLKYKVGVTLIDKTEAIRIAKI